MTKLMILLIAAALSGCVTTTEAMTKRPIKAEMISSKSPKDIATCLVRSIEFTPIVTNTPDGVYLVEQLMNYGFRLGQWTIYPTATGSRIEFRTPYSVEYGDKVKGCI
jgi:hypothetical protein